MVVFTVLKAEHSRNQEVIMVPASGILGTGD